MLEKNSDSEVHVEKAEKIERRPTDSIAFGLERMGLIAVKAPILSCIILVGLIIAAIFGIERIKIDNFLSQLFGPNPRNTGNTRRSPNAFPLPNSTCWSWSKARRCSRATISRSCAISKLTCNWSRARAA